MQEPGNKEMSEKRTATMLRRLPVILAVTAASYGLTMPGPQAPRQGANLGAKTPGGGGPANHGAVRSPDTPR
jgi:hypothetical protein